MTVRSTIELDPNPAKREIKEISEAFDTAAKRQTETWKKEGKKAGEQNAQAMKKGLTEKWKAGQARLKDQLSKGLIDRKEFRRQSNVIKEEYNRGVHQAIKKLEKQGRMTRGEYTKLAGSLKSVSRQAKKTGSEGERGMSRWRRTVDRVKKSVFSLKGAFVGIGALAVGHMLKRFFGGSVKIAEEASEIWARLEANVEAAGVSFREVRPEIDAVARSFQNVTRYGDEETAGALSELISTTGDYKGSLRELTTVLDFATAKGIQLKTAAQLVGRAMIGDTSTLKRYGVIVEEGADAMEVLREQFRGAAEVDGAKWSGRLQRLRNEWSDVRQAVGEAVLGNDEAAESMGGLAEKLMDLEQWVRANESALQDMVTGIVDATAKVGELAAAIARALSPAAAVAGPEIQAIKSLGDDLEALKAKAQELVQARAEAVRASQEDLTFGFFDTAESIHAKEAVIPGLDRAIQYINQRIQALHAAAEGAGAGAGAPGIPIPDIQTGELRQSLEELRTLGAEFIEQTAEPVTAFVQDLSTAVSAVAEAEARLQAVRMTGGDETEATQRLAAAKAELRDKLEAWAEAALNSGVQGETLVWVMERLKAVAEEAGIALDDMDVEEAGKDWEDWAETVEGLARGVLSVADAMGVLDDETRQALQGVIDIASGVQSIASGNLIGGIAQLAGGAIGFLSGAFGGGDEEERKARLNQIRAMSDLRKALKDLEDAILSGMTGREKQAIAEAGEAVLGRMGYKRDGTVTRPAISGLSDEELDRLRQLQEETGIEFLDFEKDYIHLPALAKALAAFKGMDLEAFPDTLEGQLEALAWKWGLLGEAAGTAAERFEELLEALEGIEGAEPFAEAIRAALAEGGPEAANALIDDLASRIAAGDESLFAEGGMFFGMSPEEVAALLEEGNTLIEEWIDSQGGGGASRSVQIGRSITEIQAAEVVAWLQDIAYTLREMLGLMQIGKDLSASTAALGAVVASSPMGGQAPAKVISSFGGRTIELDFRGARFAPALDDEDIAFIQAKLGEALLRARQAGKGVRCRD